MHMQSMILNVPTDTENQWNRYTNNEKSYGCDSDNNWTKIQFNIYCCLSIYQLKNQGILEIIK